MAAVAAVPWFLNAHATNCLRHFLSTTRFLKGGGVLERGGKALSRAAFFELLEPFLDFVEDLRVLGVLGVLEEEVMIKSSRVN